jgi:hypothetical protein
MVRLKSASSVGTQKLRASRYFLGGRDPFRVSNRTDCASLAVLMNECRRRMPRSRSLWQCASRRAMARGKASGGRGDVIRPLILAGLFRTGIKLCHEFAIRPSSPASRSHHDRNCGRICPRRDDYLWPSTNTVCVSHRLDDSLRRRTTVVLPLALESPVTSSRCEASHLIRHYRRPCSPWRGFFGRSRGWFPVAACQGNCSCAVGESHPTLAQVGVPDRLRLRSPRPAGKRIVVMRCNGLGFRKAALWTRRRRGRVVHGSLRSARGIRGGGSKWASAGNARSRASIVGASPRRGK